MESSTKKALLPHPCNVVFVLGAPGSGKGTQCSRLVEKYHEFCRHVSAGDVMRNAKVDVTSPYHQQVVDYLKEGKEGHLDVMVDMLGDEIERIHPPWNDQLSSPPLILIDGFPRSLYNLQGWETKMSARAVLKAVLLFEGPVEAFVERCRKRGRSEDTEEMLNKRVEMFQKNSIAVIEHFKEQNLLHRVDSFSGLDADDTFERVESVLHSLNRL